MNIRQCFRVIAKNIGDVFLRHSVYIKGYQELRSGTAVLRDYATMTMRPIDNVLQRVVLLEIKQLF